MPLRYLDALATESAGMVRLLRILLVASVLLPTLLFTAIAWRDFHDEEAQAERNIRKTVLILHEHMQKVFDTVEQVLDRLDERTAGMSWDEIGRSDDLHGYLRTLVEEVPQIGVVGLVDPNGALRNDNRLFPAPLVNVGDREYFRTQAASDAGILVSEAITGRGSGKRQFNVTRRRAATGGPEGPFNGVLLTAVLTDYLADFYQLVVAGPKEAISLVRHDGSVLVRFPSMGDRQARHAADSFLLGAMAAGKTEGVFRTRGRLDGVARLNGFMQVTPYPIYVTYGIPIAEIRAGWAHNVLTYAAFTVPAMLALIGITLLALRRAQSEMRAVRRWTEEARARESLESALRQSQKLEALGQLTGGVAHDFNNLLTAALANLHLMERHLPAEGTRYLDGTRTALERARTLTGQLLAFSRQEAVDPKVIDLGDALRAMADLLERSIRADIALDWALPAAPLPVEVDPVQLELAVLNLVVNARDAMPAGGRIRIAARPEETPDGPLAVLEITDTGGGMPPEVAARAFEPFFTTKPHGKGTGLGLSMVYGFARQSGGNATISSAPRRGTVVRITLPVSGRVPEPEAVPDAAETAPAGPVRLLVVEDNALVLMATVEGLTQEGFEVATADHGAAALEILEQDNAFDVIVTDVVMPYGVSGIDLARRVQERWPGIRVLLISGYSPESLTGLRADAAVLPKPFTPDQLAARVRALLRTARAV
ncbi:response regulator [Azospirillum formosense]|uniref:histidine kinase n=1 Tax=Azospirillum formosense TaxID=861533 RepID=A0ABX2L945_9PROT|nr:hybrid sensor histidine kinase/response regulator [Azospirillum formosense]MBY3753703.1 response regulator [Azospirillum formosense]NUB22666.1 response regulator [Azospirillum formosense]